MNCLRIIIRFQSIIALLLFTSCIRHSKDEKQQITKLKLDNQILEGNIVSLFDNDDTLTLAINRSSCAHPCYDILKFYKVNGELYLHALINNELNDPHNLKTESKKYNLTINDSLSFEKLIREIYLYEKQNIGALSNASTFISAGVFKKWSKNYKVDRMTKEHSDFLRMYIKIMNEFYPDIKDYTPLEPLQIIDSDSLEIELFEE